MKRKIYNICQCFLAVMFIMAVLFLNPANVIGILMNLLLLLFFKKNSAFFAKTSNKIMLVLLGVVEFTLGVLCIIKNYMILSPILFLNIIAMMLSLLIVFTIFKKNTNHAVTIFASITSLIVFIMVFNNNLNFLPLLFVFLMPVANYLLAKTRNDKLSAKKFYLINLVILGFFIIFISWCVINKNLEINLINLMLIICTVSYYYFVKIMAAVLYYPMKKIVIGKSFFTKYIKTNDIRKVTAVIPNYNYAHYMHERILSIVNQTYPIYELIILDDCSTDNSAEVIKQEMEWLAANYPNIIVKFLPNKVNSGNVFKQWQKAFELSTGEYLWICEADDLCSKYFLNAVMRGFNDDATVLSYSESKAINEYGKTFKKNLRDWIDIFNTNHWNRDYIEDGNDELKYYLATNNTIANVSGVVFKKDSKIDFIKYLNEAQKYTLAGDWYFYSKVLLNKKISYVASSLNYHRIHSSSVTSTTDNFVHYKEILSIQKSISKDVKIPKEMQKRIEERNANLRRNFCISKDELYYDSIDLKNLIKSKNINDEILLSIIIPVYNVEKYLEKCLKSVFKNLPIKTEVIIINDGSPDNSEEMIKKYIKKHKEIKYIKKDNGGLSSVKNVGLKEAKGKYIIFLDSDDYVSSNMYSTMLKKIIDTDADLVYCDVLMIYENNTVQYVKMQNTNYSEPLMQILDNNLMAASWNKIVKRKLYDNLEFPEGLNNEDVAVSPQLFLKAKKIEYIPSPFYKYVQRSGSIQNSGFNEKRFVIFDTAKICFEAVKTCDSKSYEMIIGTIINHQILAILIYLIMPIKNKEMKRKYIEMFCEKFNELGIDVTNNYYVCEYLKQHNMDNLIVYLYNNDIKNIEKF